MPRFAICAVAGAILIAAGWAVTARAAAQPDRLALVIGEATYPGRPALDGCPVSAEVIGTRLSALGFQVSAKSDAPNGVAGAALVDFVQRAGAATDAAVAIYFCGYAAEYSGRLFLLPAGATLDRPSDVLTQGIPARSLIDVAMRHGRAGLAVLDLYAGEKAQASAGAVTALMSDAGAAAAGHVVVAALEPAIKSTATPLAQALGAALTTPPVPLDPLVGSLRDALAGSGVDVAAAGTGGGMALAPPAAPPPPVAPKPAPRPVPAPAVVMAAPAPAAPALTMPEEAQYSDLDRRRVQAALHQLGYYNGPVDAVFGPQTEDAIRHYQHDLGDAVTGTLTREEASRLVTGLLPPAAKAGG